MTKWRWAALAVLVVVAIWTWNGATYSARDYRALLAREEQLIREIDSIRHDVDSLRAFSDSFAKYESVQERTAREKLGMLRPGEILILLVPDSTPPSVTQ